MKVPNNWGKTCKYRLKSLSLQSDNIINYLNHQNDEKITNNPISILLRLCYG